MAVILETKNHRAQCIRRIIKLHS